MSQRCRNLLQGGFCFDTCSISLPIRSDVQFYDGISCENNNVGVDKAPVFLWEIPPVQAGPLLKRRLMLVSPLSCSLSTCGNAELLSDGSVQRCAAPLGEALQRSDMTVQRLDSLSSSHFKQNKHLHRCKGIDLAWLFHRAAEFGSWTCQRLSHCRLVADKVFSLNEHMRHKLMSSPSFLFSWAFNAQYWCCGSRAKQCFMHKVMMECMQHGPVTSTLWGVWNKYILVSHLGLLWLSASGRVSWPWWCQSLLFLNVSLAV